MFSGAPIAAAERSTHSQVAVKGLLTTLRNAEKRIFAIVTSEVVNSQDMRGTAFGADTQGSAVSGEHRGHGTEWEWPPAVQIIFGRNVRTQTSARECRLLGQKAPSVALPAEEWLHASSWRNIRGTVADVEQQTLTVTRFKQFP